METEKYIIKEMLANTGINILDCARLIKNILDFKPRRSKLSDMQFCTKIVESGIKHLNIKEKSIQKGFELYLLSKTHLRKDSFRDIKYLGKRLLKANPKFAKMNFSELTISQAQKWLSETFNTPSQFNKAHTMLHGLFNYALRNEWVEKNIVKLVQKKKVIEREIKALTLEQIKSLLKTANLPKFQDCKVGLGLLIWAGIRPTELNRLTWDDIDLDENIITIRSQTSKTGGTRHIEICKPLKKLLEANLQKAQNFPKLQEFPKFPKPQKFQTNPKFPKVQEFPIHQKVQKFPKGSSNQQFSDAKITPKNWKTQFKSIRDISGFRNLWVQDVLRHTYASYFAKHFQNMPLLQLNMGHSNQNLLRSRYINLQDISKTQAKSYFSAAS